MVRLPLDVVQFVNHLVTKGVIMIETPFIDSRTIRSGVTMEQILRHYNLLGNFENQENKLTGLCPIHGEKHFTYDKKSNSWNCVGKCCGGDVIDFVAEMEKVSLTKSVALIIKWFKMG